MSRRNSVDSRPSARMRSRRERTGTALTWYARVIRHRAATDVEAEDAGDASAAAEVAPSPMLRYR